MGLKVGELKLKIDGDVRSQSESPAVSFANGSEGKRDIAGKFGEVHDRIGVDGNHEVVFTLEGGEWGRKKLKRRTQIQFSKNMRDYCYEGKNIYELVMP